MSNSGENRSSETKPRTRHYADILNPLFWKEEFNNVDRLFELVCTLVRAAGLQDTGWDSHHESLELLADLRNLGDLDLPSERFPTPQLTRARLTLLSYSHVIEMNVPYELLANLLRLRLGHKYAINPFSHLGTPIVRKTKQGRVLRGVRPPSPEKKIKEIERLSSEAEIPQVGIALRGIYDSSIRNAVYHSDYALHQNSMRLLSGYRFSRKEGVQTPVIGFAELAEVTNEAFAFSALFALYERVCCSFTDFKDSFLPFDSHYKGLLELSFDGDRLSGFRAYWPNGSLSLYSRTKEGCYAQNIRFEADGSINFMVGILASTPSAFSPCVESGAEPVYAEVPGTTDRPYWPEQLRAYKLPR